MPVCRLSLLAVPRLSDSEQEQEEWDLRVAAKASVFLDDVDAFVSEWRDTGAVFGWEWGIEIE